MKLGQGPFISQKTVVFVSLPFRAFLGSSCIPRIPALTIPSRLQSPLEAS